MIIENQDALKNWLIKYLQPLCEADPQALAKYIMALIKKDKPEKELRNICFDKLEVFLSKETVKFVDVFFQTLASKSYLNATLNTNNNINSNNNNNVQGSTVTTTATATLNSTINNSSTNKVEERTLNLSSNEVNKNNVNINVTKQRLSSDNIIQEREHNLHLSPKNSLSDHQATSMNTSTTSSVVNRVSSPSQSKKTQYLRRSKSRSRSRSRSKSPYSSHQRHQRNAKLPNSGFHMDNRSHDDRIRKNRLPVNRINSQLQRGGNRRYGPSTSRGNVFKKGSNVRNLMRNHSRSRSRSRSSTSSRSSRSRSRSRNRSSSRDRTGPLAKKPRTNPKSPSPPRDKDSSKKRCRDYDEQGFCIRGELCPFDHGKDPLVLDSNVSQMVLSQFNQTTALLPTPNVTTNNPFAAEPYNPEAPAIDLTNNQQMRNQLAPGAAIPPPHFWQQVGRMPPPNLPQTANFNPLPQQQQQQQQPPQQAHQQQPQLQIIQQRPRELRGVPTIGDNCMPPQDMINRTDLQINNNNMNENIAISNLETSQRSVINNRGNRRGGRGGHRGGYKGGHRRLANTENADKCTLEVRKIPASMNTITHLNEHFGKFGQIVNLHICYDNDSEAALVQFASHHEALSAYRCTEAVLNNRFIKVFWHSKSEQQQQEEHQKQFQQKDDNNSEVKDEATKNSTNEIHRISAKERLGVKVNDLATQSTGEKITTAISSSGIISRTVFNPNLLKKVNQPQQQTSTNLTNAKPNLTKTKEEQKKESLQKKVELHKKKQEILKVYMADQKHLIEKLEKAKTEEDKVIFRETLMLLSDKVRHLEGELKKDFQDFLVDKNVKTKAIKSRIQLEKELLDAEMDYYNKMHKGEITFDVQKRLNELRLQAKEAGIKNKSQKFLLLKQMQKRNAYRNTFDSLRKVDKRTRKILIPGINEVDQIDLLSHLAQFAIVESIDHSNSGAIVTFKTRQDAEKAVSQIGTIKFKDHFSLKSTWFDEAKSKASQQQQQQQQEQQISGVNDNEFKTISESDIKAVEKDLLDKDEDDLLGVEMDDDILEENETDDENESRSWRR